MSMGKQLRARDYELFARSLKGPLSTIKGEIYEVFTETFGTFGIGLNIVIHETEVEPTIISDLMKEISSKFQDMYDGYTDEDGNNMGKTLVRIKNLMFTGGLDVDINYIGFNLNNAMNTVLPSEKLQWTKDVHTVNDLIQYTKNPEVLQLMELEESTIEKLNRSLKQLYSQKNVPHNLQIHLDFVEEGTFMIDTHKVHYKLPENIQLVCHSDARNHNKITGYLDFDYQPIHVEFPISDTLGKNMYDTLVDLLSDKIMKILNSNDLKPDRYAANTNKPHFNFIINFTK